MVSEAKYKEMKERIPHIKHLFQSRHYVQCATICDRLLTRPNHDAHPVHLAYLHFYLAMCHDTMGRETSMRNRSSELDVAEKHYVAAIAALTPAVHQQLDDVPECSPASHSSEDESNFNGRRVSDAASLSSEHSVASSTTSYADDESTHSDLEPTTKNAGLSGQSQSTQRNADDSTKSSKPKKKRPSPIITSAPKAARSFQRVQFSAELSSFISLVRMHLKSVQELRELSAVRSVRFSYSRSRSSTASSRPASRDSSNYDESELNKLRMSRKSMSFRPRFDPTGVQKLCNEALSEL